MNRTNQIFEKIKVESNLSDTESFRKSLLEIKQVAIDNNETELIKEIQFDIDLISLCIQTPLVLESKNIRFIPRYVFENGRKYPDIDDFTEEQYEYYDIQLDVQKNIFLKQKYADFMYEHDTKSRKNKKELSEILLESLLYGFKSNRLEDDKSVLNSIDYLARMTQVSIKFKNKRYLEMILKELINFIHQSLQNTHLVKYVYEITNLISIIQNSKAIEISSYQIDELLSILNRVKQYTYEVNDLNISRELAQSIYKMVIKNKKDEAELIKSLENEIGLLCVEEADRLSETDNGIAIADLLEQARTHYLKHGMREKADELKVKIKNVFRENVEKNLGVIEFKQQIPVSDIEQIINPFLNYELKDALSMISNDQILRIVPNEADVIKLTEDLKRRSPIQFLVTRIAVSRGNKVFESKNEKENFDFIVNENYIRNLCLKISILLIPLLKKLETEKSLAWNHVFEKITQTNLINEEKTAILEFGLKKYFEKDYISSIHILVPHFEDILRGIFHILEYPTTSIKKGNTIQEVTFNTFLEREFVESTLGADLHKFIQMTMVEQTGLNLRNKVAHGLISEDECNEVNGTLVVFLYLLITNFQLSFEG